VGRAWTRSRFAFVLTLAGCGAAPETPFTVRLDLADGFVACDGQQDYLDAFVAEVFDELDQPMPAGLDITLHVVGKEELEQSGVCAEGAGGCAWAGEAWSTGAVDPHELTHVILRELAPQAIAAFGEGIADALGTPSPYWPASTPRLPLATYATRTTLDLGDGERVSAALFTTFLLEEFGSQAYLDLYSALPLGSTVEDIDARMREHLGASLDELDARFGDPAEARCMVATSHCGDVYGPVLAPPFELEQSLLCDEPGVLGYSTEDGWRSPFRRWQVLIPHAGTYRVELEGAPVFGLRCGSCDERLAPIPFHGALGMPFFDFELEAGLYTFEVNELLDGHDTFRIALREAG
jgi:hypothetical protein